jgi:hypothetical protein
MDEMRQMLRILPQLLPNSSKYKEREDNGGNRVSEAEIKDYLDRSLGSAPQPSWGCEEGWGGYIASARQQLIELQVPAFCVFAQTLMSHASEWPCRQ